ncbi:MAG: hypothetical protein QOF76_3292, partial [Solirubrobacteraceae bacterium]|nr:hypothetical protein [Solirubrobacteraceae bacterium]
MQSVAVLAVPGVVAFDLATPCHVFEIVRPRAYRVAVCGAGRVSAGAFDIVPPHGLDVLRNADTVVVPGVADLRAAIPPQVLDALRAAAARGARIASICVGAFTL